MKNLAVLRKIFAKNMVNKTIWGDYLNFSFLYFVIVLVRIQKSSNIHTFSVNQLELW